MKKIGILTGGGDAPGLNAVISAITLCAIKDNVQVLGILDGWKGMLSGDYRILNKNDIEDINREGGTIIGTSRTNVRKVENGIQQVKDTFKKLELDCLFALGGEDTLGVASTLYDEKLNIIGVPKTIDNDLSATDYTFGFDTAINRVMESLDRLHTTAKSHSRIMVVEIMGRHAGWMALYGGIAGGAHIVLIPEDDFIIDDVCKKILARTKENKKYTMIAVAEGAKPKAEDMKTKKTEKDDFGHVMLGGIGEMLAREIEKRTKLEARHVVLGHLQRGGAPSAFDRILATRFGLKAYELCKEGKFGYMPSLSGARIVAVSLKDATGQLKTVPLDLYNEFKSLL